MDQCYIHPFTPINNPSLDLEEKREEKDMLHPFTSKEKDVKFEILMRKNEAY